MKFKLLFIILGLYTSVWAETPEEMVKFILKANRTAYWPDLSCIPHGFSYNASILSKMKPKELEDAGVRSMFYLEKLIQKCEGLVDKNKQNIDTDKKKEACRVHCILQELGIFKSLWNKPIEVGFVDVAAGGVAQLLSAKLRPGQSNLSVDLTSEIVSRHVILHMKFELELRAKVLGDHHAPISCLREEEYKNFIGWSFNGMLAKACQGGFPTEHGWMLRRDLSRDEVSSRIWPDLECLKRRFGGGGEALPANSAELWPYNAFYFCRDTYLLFQMRKEVGEIVPETCFKICVLRSLSILRNLDLKPGTRIPGIFEQKFIAADLKGEGFKGVFEVLLPTWNRTEEGRVEMANFREALGKVITQSLTVNNLHDGAECVNVKKWGPVVRDFEIFLDKECKAMPQSGELKIGVIATKTVNRNKKTS